ncbi:MAG: ATP-binding protein [Ferruginibacter sp.]
MKKFLIILILLIVFKSGKGQNLLLDSLKKSLSIVKEDTTHVLLLSEISLWSIFSNPDTSLLLAKEGLRLAQQTNYAKGEAYCKRSLGFFFWSTGDYTTAINLAFMGMPYAEASNDFDLQIWLNDLLLNAYRDNGDYNEAIKYDQKNRMISQRLNQPIDASRDAMVANIYYDMNKLDSALHYIRLSFKKGGIADGWMCMAMGKIQTKVNHADSAFYYYKLSIAKLTIDKNFKDLANVNQSIAALYYSNGNTDSAIYYAQNGLALAQQNSFAKEQFNLRSFLAEVYEKRNTDSAFRYYKLAMVAKDSLFSKEKTKQILSIQFNDEIRRREVINAEVQYKNRLKTYGFIAGLFIALIIATILWRNNQRKQKANLLLQFQKEKVESALLELKAAQTQLIHSEKMASLGELTAGIAHEIQNPLNFVNNFSEVNKELIDELEQEVDKGNYDEVKAIVKDIKDNEQKINHHGKRADAIVKGMLQHSRSSTGVKEATNINALCDEYLRLSYHGLRAKDKNFNADFNTDFDDTIEKINIIPQDIGRVLLNLYNNAFYATNERKKTAGEEYKPLVTVQTKKINSRPDGTVGRDQLEIKVSDNGNGIPQNIVAKIFQPFFTTKPTGQGTGLGLSLSYDIVKAHGGEIKVETKEGEGTTFIIQWPM